MARRVGSILAVADVARSVEFYRDRIGFEVEDARAEHRRLGGEGVCFLAEPYEPPWGGCRFFCVDPDGYLVEIEEPA